MRKLVRHLHTNVSPVERGASVIGGSYFLYDALAESRKNPLKMVLASYLLYRGISGNCLLYNALGKTKPDNRSRNVNIQVRQRINRPRKEVYDFWRDFENLPLFMEHLEEVHSLNDSISVWSAKLPGGLGKLQWKSEIVKEIPDQLIGWQSLPGSSIGNAGKVEFFDAPGGGTEIHIVISYHAPGGLPGEGAARLINPLFKEVVEQDLENFKWFFERKF